MLDRTPPSPTLRPIVLSTDSWIPQTRFEAWRDEFALRIARVDVNTPDKDAFAADISVLPLPHIAISKTAVAPCSLTRTRSLIRDGDDGLVFILCLEGEADIRFGEDHVHLRPSTGHARQQPPARGSFLDHQSHDLLAAYRSRRCPFLRART